jgi:hypothetical protein
MISLQRWAESRFTPAPHANTLRAWARDGKITPQPSKIGRAYYVHPQAQHVDELFNSTRLISRLD